mgnify:CR=1 FL=1
MNEIFFNLIQAINQYVNSGENKVLIYEEIIPSLNEYDEELIIELTQEDSYFKKAYKNFLKENIEDYDIDL